MNIVYIAYSCSPYHGSEDKIGWNIPLISSKTNKVFVITKEEQREYIEKYLKENPLENICFYYVDIPDFYKKIYKGFLFSGRLNIWHKRALKIAQKICQTHKIDIIHQITPVEFRSIGNYSEIPNVKFVCGPIGGGQNVPKPLRQYTKSHLAVEFTRGLINNLYRLIFLINGKLKRCDRIIFANYETKNYLKKLILPSAKSDVLTDIAIAKDYISPTPKLELGGKRKFLVAGRLVYLKGHNFLFDALEKLPKDLDYECRIVGSGTEYDRLKIRCSQSSLSENVLFVGAVDYEQMSAEYENSDVLIMPSLREATGSVILEAMAKGLPVITLNKFGGATILDNDTGWLYDGANKEEYIENLRLAITQAINSPDEVLRKGKNALKRSEDYIWEKKMEYYKAVYEDVMS